MKELRKIACSTRRDYVRSQGLRLMYEGVSKSFWTGCLERELQMVELSATRWSCIAILWVSLVSFADIILCVASQRVIIVVTATDLIIESVRKLWIHPCKFVKTKLECGLMKCRINSRCTQKACFLHGGMRIRVAYLRRVSKQCSVTLLSNCYYWTTEQIFEPVFCLIPFIFLGKQRFEQMCRSLKKLPSPFAL